MSDNNQWVQGRHPSQVDSAVAVTRGLGLVALLGNTIWGLCFIALHFIQPMLSPIDDAVSYYVHGEYGWVLTVGFVAWGVGSLALLAGLIRTGELHGQLVGLLLLGVWGVGLLVGGVFPADPAGQWDKPPSVAGMIHGNVALVAFIALPIAALLLSRKLRQVPAWVRLGKVLSVLSIATLVSLIAFGASVVPVMITPGPPILFGLTERILLVAYLAWLDIAAIGLLQQSAKPS